MTLPRLDSLEQVGPGTIRHLAETAAHEGSGTSGYEAWLRRW